MTTFHWVRHGPTHEPNFVGWRDVPADLSDDDTIARVHDFLPADAVVTSSDLRRSTDTADAIAGDRRRYAPLPGLREFHFGSWDGRAADEIKRDHPQLYRAYWQHPGNSAPPGGESWNDAAARVSAAADHLARCHAGQNIVVVAHFGAILTQLQRALACPALDVLQNRIDNLSITSIEFSDTASRVIRINHKP